jgi:hypothetical protein
MNLVMVNWIIALTCAVAMIVGNGSAAALRAVPAMTKVAKADHHCSG